jgi:hypothetical protein
MIKYEITDPIGIDDGLKVRVRHAPKGQRKPHHLEIDDETVWNSDRQRPERRRMVVDRENDRYLQEWTDQETGEVWFFKQGPLSDLDMHGESARRSKGDRPTP